MRVRLYLFLLIAFTTISGCSKQHFVVLRDVPENPSFVVIPANNYLYQVEFANSIEAAIISAGVKVVTRPISKEVLTEQKMGKAETQATIDDSTTQAGEARLIERYVALDNTDADYVVYTYVDSRQVKIAKKDTGEILTVFGINLSSNSTSWESIRYQVGKALEAAGIVQPVDSTH